MPTVEKLHESDRLAREMGERDAQELAAALETEKIAEEKEKQVSELNVFTLDPNGFKTHWKIVSGTTPDQLNAMTQRQTQLSKWLSEHHYKPDEMGRGSSNGNAAAPAPPQAVSAPPGAAVWVVSPDGSRSCSLHGPANWKPPGVSRTTNKPYTGFWGCVVKECKPVGAN